MGKAKPSPAHALACASQAVPGRETAPLMGVALALSMCHLPVANVHTKLRKLGQKRCLVIEAAQVQGQCSILDVPKHRDWQLAQRQDQRLETAARALAVRRRNG